MKQMPQISGKPVVFLTFANAAGEGHLQQLKRESALLRDLFLPLHQSGQIEMVREESLENTELPKLLNRYKSRISIFHYGGHADGTQLALEDGKGHAEGLAELLSLQTNLKLVFLNGCATQEQARPYLEAGVPVVLATTRSIPDEDATWFAEHFYHALLHGHTIREAFKSASGALRTRSPMYKNRQEGEVTVFRSIGAHENKLQDLPWQLYVQQGKEAALDWSLTAIPKNGNEDAPGTEKRNRKQQAWQWVLAAGVIVGIISGVIAIFQPFFGRSRVDDAMQLTVYVQGADGKPIAEIQHKGQIIVDFGNDRRAPLIGENGRTNLGEIPEKFRGEKIPIVLKAEGYEPVESAGQYVMDGNPVYFLVKRDNSLGTIQGIVQTRDGSAFIAGALVMIDHDTTTYTDSLGRFRLVLPEKMHKESYLLIVKKAGFKDAREMYRPKTTPADIRLER